MDKKSLTDEIVKHGFFYYEEPLFDGMQPYTSAIGRICIAEKRLPSDIYTGVIFWLHEAENQWFLGLYSPQWFLARNSTKLLDLVIHFLARQQRITSSTGLSPNIIKKYELTDWTDVVANPSWTSVLLCKATSSMTLDEVRTTLAEPPFTKQEFVDRMVRFLDTTIALEFNGLEFTLRGAKGILRFVHNSFCLEIHEMLIFAESLGAEFTDDQNSLISLVCTTLNCAAFEHSGKRIA